MTGFLSDLRSRARVAARTAAFTVAGVIFALTGVAFLTVALWVLLASYENTLVASTVIGLMYLLLGICFFLLGSRSKPTVVAPRPTPQAPPKTDDPFLRVAEAFAVGLQAGRSARRPRR